MRNHSKSSTYVASGLSDLGLVNVTLHLYDELPLPLETFGAIIVQCPSRRTLTIACAVSTAVLVFGSACASPDSNTSTPTSSQGAVADTQNSNIPKTSGQKTTPTQTSASTPQVSQTTQNNAPKGKPEQTSASGAKTSLVTLTGCEDPKLVTALAPITSGYKPALEQNSMNSQNALLCHWVNNTGQMIMVTTNPQSPSMTLEQANTKVAQDPEQALLVTDPRLGAGVAIANGNQVKTGKAESLSVIFSGQPNSHQILVQSVGSSIDTKMLTNVVAQLTQAPS